MMRYIKCFLLIVVAIGLVFVALANRAIVELKLVPSVFSDVIGFNFSISLPLFVVIFGGMILGLMIGYAFEYLREIKYRRSARKEHKQVVMLEREIARLKSEKSAPADDILALIKD